MIQKKEQPIFKWWTILALIIFFYFDVIIITTCIFIFQMKNANFVSSSLDGYDIMSVGGICIIAASIIIALVATVLFALLMIKHIRNKKYYVIDLKTYRASNIKTATEQRNAPQVYIGEIRSILDNYNKINTTFYDEITLPQFVSEFDSYLKINGCSILPSSTIDLISTLFATNVIVLGNLSNAIISNFSKLISAFFGVRCLVQNVQENSDDNFLYAATDNEFQANSLLNGFLIAKLQKENTCFIALKNVDFLNLKENYRYLFEQIIDGTGDCVMSGSKTNAEQKFNMISISLSSNIKYLLYQKENDNFAFCDNDLAENILYFDAIGIVLELSNSASIETAPIFEKATAVAAPVAETEPVDFTPLVDISTPVEVSPFVEIAPADNSPTMFIPELIGENTNCEISGEEMAKAENNIAENKNTEMANTENIDIENAKIEIANADKVNRERANQKQKVRIIPPKKFLAQFQIQELLTDALAQKLMPLDIWKKIDKLHEYLLVEFGLGFSNKQLVQMENYTSVYVACGGSSEAALDNILCKKLRNIILNNKFEVKKIKALQKHIIDVFGEDDIPQLNSFLYLILQSNEPQKEVNMETEECANE